jgi:hypothetical protein
MWIVQSPFVRNEGLIVKNHIQQQTVDSQLAIGHCRGSSHSERLTCETTFAKKVPVAQDPIREVDRR